MNSTNHSQNNRLTLSWLKLGILSLGFAGLYSVILVVLRTPQLSSFFPNPHIFKSALIIHVNLSVLIWLLSVTASVWGCETSLRGEAKSRRGNLKNFALLHEIATLSTFARNDVFRLYPKLAFLATLLIAISPIAGHNPVMNNYIPMLENIVFILGLSLFGVTLLLYAINILYFFDWTNLNNLVNFTILSTIIMFILSFVCFGLSYKGLQNIIQIIPIEIEFYYELLFWSGGHLLQFIYTQILIFIWIVLFQKLIGRELKFQKFYLFLLYLNFIFGVLIVCGHISYDIIDGSFKEFYTNHMKYLGGITPVLCLAGMGGEGVCHCTVIASDCKERGNLRMFAEIASSIAMQFSRNDDITKTTLLCSITLFLLGGLIAMNITGIDVVIPAHYHGSIVGISIACMGYSYLGINVISVRYVMPAEAGIQKKILEKMDSRLCGNDIRGYGTTFAVYLLTFGQILHILGLAFAGGYGVMRKDPNSVMPMSAKLLMGMMGGGGLIAIVGGLMFVYICGKTMFLKSIKLEHE
ncbi:cbb3-type cytochrome c oxidase subunit I [Rickettsia sp. TH2014]|uniref:cbb3-type cytochrome c oxidase subunit I n=1 Tax=Rickettsia sp. TH2014 TaxID=1967503 RepID=UPI001C46925A|nr:cbb3-type cytochrome c oxidase subunit I [Rickettsia sp. TH2014]